MGILLKFYGQIVGGDHGLSRTFRFCHSSYNYRLRSISSYLWHIVFAYLRSSKLLQFLHSSLIFDVNCFINSPYMALLLSLLSISINALCFPKQKYKLSRPSLYLLSSNKTRARFVFDFSCSLLPTPNFFYLYLSTLSYPCTHQFKLIPNLNFMEVMFSKLL